MASTVTLVGPFTGDDGMAEFARRFGEELTAGGVAARFVDVHVPSLANHRRIDTSELEGTTGPVVFLLNPPELMELARQLGPPFFQGRPAAGLWWLEAPRLPPQWKPAADLLDEVWGASDYICQQVEVAGGHCVRCPLPSATLAPRVSQSAVKTAKTPFRFLVTFDYRSTVERKNPDGALRAYLQAFPEPRPDVRLTIKTQAAERVPYEARRLRRMARDRPDVTIMDARLPRAELDALFEASTCYVSLHRAEGLGLGLLEAMRVGKPVIATGFSGNLQFMPPDYPFLVRWAPARIPRQVPLYGGVGGRWADPDVTHAASLMRAIVEQPALAADAARRGLAHLETLAKRERLADFVQDSLPRLEAALHERPPTSAALWRASKRQRLLRAVVDRVEKPLRRVPLAHKFAMDVFFGRYGLRRRRR